MTNANNVYENKTFSFGERLSYALSNIGGNLVYTTISSFVTLYYTDSVGIAAATAGTMMLIARIFDGFSDIIMGGIIDKTHTKWGQARPWFIISIIPLVLSLILVFAIPDSMSYTGKVVWMYVTYIFSAVIAFTMCTLSAVAMQALMTGDIKQRMGLNSLYQIFGFVIIIVLNMVTPNVYGAIGWRNMALLYAALSTICLVIPAVVCKETKHLCATGEVKQNEHKVSLKVGLLLLVKNKYFWIILVLSIMNYIGIGTFNGAGIFFTSNVLHNPGLFGLLTIAGMGPTILLTGFVPKVAMKLGKKNTIFAGYILQTVGYGLAFIANANLPLILVGLIIKGVGLAGVAGLLIPMIGDVIDYGELQNGMRLDGLTNSVSSLGIKLGTGLGSALVGWLLAWGAYQAGSEVQPESALIAMRMLVGGIPAIVSLIGVIFSFFFNVEQDVQKLRASK